MKKTIFVVIGLSLMFGAGAKTQAQTLTAYHSAATDLDYAAPSGWYFLASDTLGGFNVDGAPRLFFNLYPTLGTKPYSMAVISVYYNKSDTVSAKAYAYKLCFGVIQVTKVFRPDLAPAVRVMQDTIISQTHFIGIEVTTPGSASVVYAKIRGNRLIVFEYWVSDTDWEANRTAYYQNFVNANFYTATPTGAKQSATQSFSQQESAKQFFDALGRQRSTVPTKSVMPLIAK